MAESIEELLAEAARSVPLPSFRVDDRVFAIVPVAEPGRIHPALYSFVCPDCDQPSKLATFRVHIPPNQPHLVTIDGVVRCHHDCGWAAEIVSGVARDLRNHG